MRNDSSTCSGENGIEKGAGSMPPRKSMEVLVRVQQDAVTQELVTQSSASTVQYCTKYCTRTFLTSTVLVQDKLQPRPRGSTHCNHRHGRTKKEERNKVQGAYVGIRRITCT